MRRPRQLSLRPRRRPQEHMSMHQSAEESSSPGTALLPSVAKRPPRIGLLLGHAFLRP